MPVIKISGQPTPIRAPKEPPPRPTAEMTQRQFEEVVRIFEMNTADYFAAKLREGPHQDAAMWAAMYLRSFERALRDLETRRSRLEPQQATAQTTARTIQERVERGEAIPDRTDEEDALLARLNAELTGAYQVVVSIGHQIRAIDDEYIEKLGNYETLIQAAEDAGVEMAPFTTGQPTTKTGTRS